MKNSISFLVGVLFALGLGISGMTRPHIVRGFLDVFGTWDWRLMGVMVGAIGIHFFAFKFIMKRSSPILDTQFQVPSKKHLDARLILGAMLFGIGWGWAGICPGPGIVGLASGNWAFIVFVVAMLAGMKIFQVVERKLKSD